jgi:hypothetical protein
MTKMNALFVWWKVIFWKSLSKLSCVCLSLEKLINEKHFPVKGKFGLVSKKVFSFYFERKTLFGRCEKFKNIILFVIYIKFSPQIFFLLLYIYIYFFFFFLLNIYFLILSLIIFTPPLIVVTKCMGS